MSIHSIMKFLAKGNKCQFDIPVKEQLTFIDTLPEVENDFQRSFNQYKAQMFFVSSIKRILFNVVCSIISPLLFFLLTLKGFFIKNRCKTDAIIQDNTYTGAIPDEVTDKYNICKENLWSRVGSFSIKDSGFLVRLLKYYFRSPYFVFKILFKLALYSQLIRRYGPNAIVVFNEYSFTSSILTAYCESKRVEHIDIMHGEKLLFIRDSFFRFTKCYIWDDYYKELFIKMKAYPDQFVSAIPPFIKIDLHRYKNEAVHSDYKYYLANYTEAELASIVKVMSRLKGNDTKIVYRPHPRYSDIDLLRRYVSEDEIEYPKEVNIMESVANCNTAVGCFTTVLNQAFHSGIDVIIDDVNFPEAFKKLAELEYVLLNKNLSLLSKIIHHVS